MRGWWVWVGLLAGCGGDGGAGDDEAHDAAVVTDAAPAAVEVRCAPGSMKNAAGECVTVGVRGCADRWRDDEGRCRPKVEDCLPDGIPNLATGACAPVGLPACPDVFREPDGRCLPSAAKCAEGTMPVPSMGCVSLDELAGGCGDAPFGNVEEWDANVYVDPQAPDGGDGSRARPFRTIAEAAAALPPSDDEDGRVVLAAGEYVEPVVLGGHKQLVGRCASMVRIAATGGPMPAVVPHGHHGVVTVAGTKGAIIRDVTIAADDRDDRLPHGLRVHDGHADLERVRFAGFRQQALILTGGAAVRARWLDVDSRGQQSPGGAEGLRAGLTVDRGGSLLVERCAVLGKEHEAVAAMEGGALDLRDCLLEGTGWYPHPDVAAVAIGRGAMAHLEGNAIVGNRYGIRVSDGGDALLRHNLVADSVGDGLGLASGDAFGLLARFGARVALVGNAFVGNGPAAARVESLDTVVESRGNLFAGGGGFGARDGVGLELRGRARMVSREDVFFGNTGAGVRVYSNEGPGTALDMAGAIVAGTRAEADGKGGHGVALFGDADVRLTDSVVVDNQQIGVLATLNASRLLADHCDIADTTPRGEPAPQLGVGVAVQLGAAGTLRRCRVEGNHVAGVFVAGIGLATRVDFEDGLVAGTVAGRFLDVQSQPHEGVAYPFVATRGATLCVRRSVVRPGRDVALLYDASDGCVEETDARALPIGLSVQGSPQPVFTPGDPLLGVIETGGNLPTPNVETPLP